MAGPRFRLGGQNTKHRPPLRFCAKVSLAIILALSFIVLWSLFSSPSSTINYQRSSFGDVTDPQPPSYKKSHHATTSTPPPPSPDNVNISSIGSAIQEVDRAEAKNATSKPEEVEEVSEGDDADVEDGVDVDQEGDEESEKKKVTEKRKWGLVFHPAMEYNWRLCGGRIGQNYIPCADLEGLGVGRAQSHRHHERSCPKIPIMCLVPLPKDYQSPVRWPESESKIWYNNVAHPQLSAFIKTRTWLNLSGEYLAFPPGGAHHYLDSIEELAPDIELGKNIRVILDIQSTDDSFGATVLEKDVIVLSLGLMNDQTDLAQITLERGIPAVVGSLGTRRLPFPSGVFDAIHCSECSISWHSSGGRLLLEMNRVLRPGGYFIMSNKHGDIDREEGMSTLTASICWNILAHKTDEASEMGVKIYQKPASNDIYDLRRRNEPPLCKEDENQDAAWYIPIETCLHKVPEAIEQHGADWPEEWPKRLETFPDWLGDLQEKLTEDNRHWKAIVNNSYLNGMGIDWSNIRNVMDMKAIYGGFAAALASEKVWVMNVVPAHAPNTLPIIYERGLLGIYHDWCEPFSTYPRSYDLLHADHLFSRLKGRCKKPVVIVVEMDRILRPGGWAIIRDKLEILNPLEMILKTLHWEIRFSYGKDKEGIICVQKTSWRPSAT